MATTSLWHIKGRLKDLIDYVENPEKTVPSDDLQGFLNVFSYVRNPEKTDNGEYVSAVNCLKETALEQMILTKKQYQKSGGYIAWHGYQSFKPNEVTPEQCHEIGLKLAREMWGDKYQIIVTTHLDKEHLHNHICFNSVSFIDGRKYDYSKSEQKRLRNVSDRISYSPYMPEQYKKAWRPHQKTTGILALYYYWCYQLGIFPKGTDYKPTSPLMKQELRKLDEISAQVRYMSAHNISTLSDLHADRDKNQTELDRLTDYRRHLQNRIRRALPAEKEKLREEKQGVTAQITELRRRLKYAAAIEKRSAHIDDCLNQIHDTLENQRSIPSTRTGSTDRRREELQR